MLHTDMNSELVIGIRAENIDTVAELLKGRVGDSYERRESSYLGEYNLFRAPESVMVKYNYVPPEKEWDEPNHKEYKVLLVVGKTDRPEYFQQLAKSLKPESLVIRCRDFS